MTIWNSSKSIRKSYTLDEPAKQNSIVIVYVLNTVAWSGTERRQWRIPELVEKVHNTLTTTYTPSLIRSTILCRTLWMTAQQHAAETTNTLLSLWHTMPCRGPSSKSHVKYFIINNSNTTELLIQNIQDLRGKAMLTDERTEWRQFVVGC